MAKNSIRWIVFPLIFASGLFFLLQKNFLPGASPQSTPKESLQLLEAVVRLVQQDYVEVPDPGKTMSGAFKGLVGYLDVLSSYLNKTSVDKYQDRLNADFTETGMILYKRYGAFPMVIGIKEGSPAEESGMKLGDPIYALDDISALDLSMLELNLYLRDRESKPVKIKTTRGYKNLTIEIARSRLHPRAFTYKEEQNLSGVLQVHNLFPPIVDQLRKELVPKLKGQNRTLVLDMRNCYDGTLVEAARFANLFLKEDTIGHLEQREGQKQTFSCPEPALLTSPSLIVWANQATFGPAELAISALQKFRDAQIIGHKTLGLAARQRFFPLSDGSGLLITSALYQPAGNQELWLKGLDPDIEVEAADQDYAAFLKQTRKQTEAR